MTGEHVDRSYFIPAGTGSRHGIFPGVDILTNAGKGIMLSLANFEPGSLVPDHSHPHEQMGMMVSGRLEFTVGGVAQILTPGDVWRIPGDVVHRVGAFDVSHPIRDDYL